MRHKITLFALFALTVTASSATNRPPVMGPNAGISAGHPLTSAAAFEILTKGGNAFDARGNSECDRGAGGTDA